MTFDPNTTHTQPGDLIQLVSATRKIYFIRLTPGKDIQTHRGIIYHDDLIGIPWGSQVYTHIGSPHYLLQPTMNDLLNEIKRNTQIIYPKDIGFIILSMNIGPGVQVVEAGTGSGALTTALAWSVGPNGRVISYEAREQMQTLAQKNLTRVGLEDRVTFKLRDIAEGFDETNVHALFLDLPNPYDYIEQVRKALKPGGFFGSILPTYNQVSILLNALRRYDFEFVEVCEILLRFYKPVADRLRPVDRMVAHTGFLIFARPMLPSDKPEGLLQEGLSTEDAILSDDDPIEE